MGVIGITPTVRAQGDIEFRVHFFDEQTNETRSESFVLDYENGWHVMTNLQSCLHRLADTRMRNAVAGDCATCKNFRMVDVEKRGGQIMREHCPDCRDGYLRATPAFPVERS